MLLFPVSQVSLVLVAMLMLVSSYHIPRPTERR